MEENGFETRNNEQIRPYVKKEKNIQKYILIFIFAILFVFVLIFSIIRIAKLQSENEKLANMCEEYEEKIKEQNIDVKDYFSDIDGVTAFESGSEKHKNLNIICYFSLTADNVSEVTTSIANRIEESQEQDWFDYDYIMVDFCNEYAGRITSMTIDANDLNRITQTNEWYGDKKLGDGEKNYNAEKSEEKNIYADENVVIVYDGMSGYDSEYTFNYTIENLTDKTLTVQVRETSINGYMVEPLCSIEIAPGKKSQDGMTIWMDDAEKHPMNTVENVETKFHIFNSDDWMDGYDTENIVIIE